MKQRKEQFDILKGIGILLVIICHAGLGGFSKEVIYSFHMPLFFFVSGYFFLDAPFVVFLVKNIKQLLIPYFLFVLSFIFVYQVRSSDYLSTLSNTLASLNPLNESDRYLYDSIWFLICLFNVRILYWIINKVCRGNLYLKLSVCACFYIGGYILFKTGTNLPFFIDSAFTTLIFFSLGEVFNKKNYDNKIVPWWAVMLVTFVGVVFCAIFHPSVELKDNKFPLCLVVLSSMMIVTLYYISKCFAYISKKKKTYSIVFLDKAGVSSLCILGFHNQLFYLIGPHLRFIPPTPIRVLSGY